MIIKIKKGTILTVLLCVPLFIIACFSYDMSDYSQYTVSYNRIANGITTGYQMETGYIFAEKLASLLRMDFRVFRGIYIALALALLIISVWEYAKETTLFALLLYAIYPFLLDVVQMRHLMAVAITIYCIRFLKERSRGNILRYCIGMLLAVSQHTIAFFYFFFLLAYIKNDIRKFYRAILVVIAIEIVAMLGLNSGGVITRFYEFLFSGLLTIRGAGAFSLAKTVAVTKYYILMFGILFFLFLILQDKSNTSFEKINLSTEGMYDLLFRISLISLTFIPFTNINDHLARANRGLFVIIYIVFIEYAKRKRATSFKRMLYRLFPLGLTTLCFFMFLSPRSEAHWETVTMPTLTNNYFIESLFEK